MENAQNINFTPARQRTFEDVGFIDVDLSVARTKPESLGLAGRTIFIGTQAYDDKYTISSSKTVGQALLTLNEPNGNPIEAVKGMFYDFSTKENEVGVFNDIYIRNAAQANKMMRIFFTTQTQIKPFSTELEISDTDTHTKLDTLETTANAIEALLTNDQDKRNALTTLSGATYAEVSNATTDIVAAAANTNGIIIRLADLNIEGGAVTCYVSTGTGTDYLAYIKSVTSANSTKQIKDIFVPAGVKLTISSNNAVGRVHIWYEVL